MHILDTAHNGMVDGIEFMLLFYRIRFEVRNKVLTERLSANRMIQLSAAERENKDLKVLKMLENSTYQINLLKKIPNLRLKN